MAKKIKIILLALIATFSISLFGFGMSNQVSASEEAIVLQVSPVKQKLSLMPGDKYTGSFKVMNVGSDKFDYTVSATPYSVVNDKYDADYSTVGTYTQIANWVTFDKSTATGTLQPGTSVDVKFSVEVPKDAPSGGQYAALMAQTESGNAENANIQVVHRVGMILYATVPGNTRSTGEIVNNTINTFFFSPPLSTSSLVKNTGNIEMTATYTVNVWPLFSNEAVYSNAEQPKTLDVMPDTSRYNEFAWEGAPRLGLFTVEQTVEFAGQTSVKKKLVLMCPLWLLFLIIAILFFLIFWVVSRARNRRAREKVYKEKEEQ